MNNDKWVFRFVLIITLVVCGLVVILNEKIIPRPTLNEEQLRLLYKLPLLNAIINGTCSVLLVLSLLAIRKKNIPVHRKINISTFFLSALFLISYVTYHYLAGDTKYPEHGSLKQLYYIILASHIILAALVLPLVLLSFHRALTQRVEAHKKLVRFTWPIWFYVTVTGVIVYLMISPYYPY